MPIFIPPHSKTFATDECPKTLLHIRRMIMIQRNIQAYSSQFKLVQRKFKRNQNLIQAYSSQFKLIQAYSSLFKPIHK